MTGPNEISIFHPAGIEMLDGPKNTNEKDSWYDILRPRTSALFTRDPAVHRERRKVWEQALSEKCASHPLSHPRLGAPADSFFDPGQQWRSTNRA